MASRFSSRADSSFFDTLSSGSVSSSPRSVLEAQDSKTMSKEKQKSYSYSGLIYQSTPSYISEEECNQDVPLATPQRQRSVFCFRRKSISSNDQEAPSGKVHSTNEATKESHNTLEEAWEANQPAVEKKQWKRLLSWKSNRKHPIPSPPPLDDLSPKPVKEIDFDTKSGLISAQQFISVAREAHLDKPSWNSKSGPVRQTSQREMVRSLTFCGTRQFSDDEEDQDIYVVPELPQKEASVTPKSSEKLMRWKSFTPKSGNQHITMKAESLTLSLTKGSIDVRIKAAKEIRVLTRSSAEARDAFGLAGAVRHLVSLLTQSDVSLVEDVVLALCNLGVKNPRNKMLMVQNGIIPEMVALLNVSPSNVKEAIIAVILSLAAEEEHRPAIGEAGAIPFITSALSSESESGRCDAVHALHNLLGFEGNRSEILENNPIPGLLSIILDKPDSQAAEKAIAVVYTLTAVENGRIALSRDSNAVAALMAGIEQGLSRSKEIAVSALLAICSQSMPCCVTANQHGAIPVLLKLHREAGSRLKMKLRLLLKCLDKTAYVSTSTSMCLPMSTSVPSDSSNKISMLSKSSGSLGESSLQRYYTSPNMTLSQRGRAGTDSGELILVKEMVEESMRDAMTKLKARAVVTKSKNKR